MGKLIRPILTDVFLRKRLFFLLDQMRKQPAIWVSGPGGCRKTTLVNSYLEARRIPCLCYEVDEGDADLATFFYYLGQAAKKAAPRKGGSGWVNRDQRGKGLASRACHGRRVTLGARVENSYSQGSS